MPPASRSSPLDRLVKRLKMASRVDEFPPSVPVREVLRSDQHLTAVIHRVPAEHAGDFLDKPLQGEDNLGHSVTAIRPGRRLVRDNSCDRDRCARNSIRPGHCPS